MSGSGKTSDDSVRDSGMVAMTSDNLRRDYWLHHCEGYRVDGVHGRLGFVDEIRIDSVRAEAFLAIRGGVLGRRVLVVPTTAVAAIVPRAMRIWLHSTEPTGIARETSPARRAPRLRPRFERGRLGARTTRPAEGVVTRCAPRAIPPGRLSPGRAQPPRPPGRS